MTIQRYFAIVDTASGQPADALADDLSSVMTRHGLSNVHQAEGLTIFASAPVTRVSHPSHGPIVLGTLFARPGGKALSALPAECGRGPDDGAVANFVKTYWGSYLAIWHDAITGRVKVLRDPSGALPCYYSRCANWTYLASDIMIMVEAGILKPTIDPRQLTMHLMAIQYRSARTSLSGISELPPGSELMLAAGSFRVREIWSPWEFARRDCLIFDAKEATARVRDTVDCVVRSWASSFAHPLLTMSGGLDSSIVAAALRAAGSNFAGLTLATANPAGDERVEARAMAAFVDAPLHERYYDISRIDLSRSAAAHLPRPTARAFGQEMDRLSLEVAAETGADSFFHGGGGDNVFCYVQSVAPILDSLAIRGIRKSMLTLRDVAMLTRTDVPTVARATASRFWSGRRAYRWAVDTRLLNQAAIEAAKPSFDHPWLLTGPNALAGSAVHIAGLLAIQNYLEGYRREGILPVIAPLLSQPLVELCLQIPSWLWVGKGMNRAVARDAFVDRLPPELYRRRTKGTPDSVTTELLEANRTAIRDMLLGGVLASHDILDTAAIDTVMRTARPADGATASRILMFCDAEAWARSVGRSGGPGG